MKLFQSAALFSLFFLHLKIFTQLVFDVFSQYLGGSVLKFADRPNHASPLCGVKHSYEHFITFYCGLKIT